MKNHLLATLLLTVFIALLGIGIIVPVMPVFATSLGASGMALGLIIAAFSISRGICQPIVGSLSDRFGRKGFLMSGLAVYGLVGLLVPEASSVANLIGIRAFHGVGSAMIVPVAMAYVSELAPIGQEGRYMGMLNVAIFSGIGGGPLIGGFFTDLWGMAAAFYAMAFLSFASLLLVFFQIPGQGCSIKIVSRPGIFMALASMLGNRRTGGILLARMATMIIMVPTMAFLPLLMSQWFSASGLQIGAVITCRTLVNAALQTPCGRQADRLDKVRLLRIGCWIIGVAICLVPLTVNFWSLLILFIILGMGEAIIWPVLGALAAEEGRHYGQGTMMGVFSLAMSTGVFIGSIGAGASMDLLGLHWLFPVVGIVVLTLSTVAVGLIKTAECTVR
ncbi:MAG: quinolone resistance protein [Deltaproteobacteria bacterium RIFOXYD12_FULL_57_12]|nr:MAG: quinolone resistance protein [Deltaproteobacteria bacterium RIFOXYD12_FULL_57_12]